MSMSEIRTFDKALPIWIKGESLTKNSSLMLRCILKKNDSALLRLACHCRYQVFINGEFYAAGPARACHGKYRISEYDISRKLVNDSNTVCIISAGYNVNSYYLTDEPSFVCAEILSSGKVVFATGSDCDFDCIEYSERVSKVQRYSFQRPFTEYYRYGFDYDSFRTDADASFKSAEIEICPDKIFISRNIPYSLHEERKVKNIICTGKAVTAAKKREFRDRSFTGIGDMLKGYKKDELECAVVNEVYAYDFAEDCRDEKERLKSLETVVYDMGVNTSGYIRLKITAVTDTTVYALFNEILDDGKFADAGRDGCANVVKWEVAAGRQYDLVSFEPYTYKYIQVISIGGECTLDSVSQYTECYNTDLLINKKKMPNEALQKVYDAAVETFIQNATDIFTDCPSRERAGWLCDSFFTARTEYTLTGKSLVESNFLENFIIETDSGKVPSEMLPMCFPADHPDGCYIPNWAMWYVLQINEYLARSNDSAMTEAAKPKLYALADFFAGYENKDGLLTKLDSWVFVEWSKANEFVQDINYPSNMLYCLFLCTLGELYRDSSFTQKSAALKAVIKEQSFDGEFFIDNAVKNIFGKYVPTKNRTETCQYYAFFTGVASKEDYPELYSKLITEFGPGRDETGKYKDIYKSNAFIGNYLRLEMLYTNGLHEQLLNEISDFFLPMAEKTGTLWENMTDHASCCHGFASSVIYWLNEIVK